jgi:hypothetical protein
MSGLVAAAMRIALRKSLIERTLAGENVYDSSATTFDEFVRENPQPFITISTDEDRSNLRDGNLLGGAREIDLVIEIAIASEVKEADIVLPHTDESLELAINIIVRQVTRAIQVDEGDAWSDVFRMLAGQPKSIESRRGAKSDQGIRYAARQIIIVYEPVDEPPFDASLPFVWQEFLKQLESDQELARLAPTFREQIIGAELPDWRTMQKRLGFSRSTIEAMAYGPLVANEEPAIFATGIGELHVTREAYGFIAVDIVTSTSIGTPLLGII